MYNESITKSISVGEMMHLREQCKNNTEIAAICGCHRATVYKMIGKQPAGIRKPYKPRNTLKDLTKLEERPVDEMPHESFAARLERAWQVKAPVVLDKQPEAVEAVERSQADIAREAHQAAMAKIKVNDAVVRVDRIPELTAVFGSLAVQAWLRVSLYDMGIPESKPMTREELLSALKTLTERGEIA